VGHEGRVELAPPIIYQDRYCKAEAREDYIDIPVAIDILRPHTYKPTSFDPEGELLSLSVAQRDFYFVTRGQYSRHADQRVWFAIAVKIRSDKGSAEGGVKLMLRICRVGFGAEGGNGDKQDF